MKRMLFLLFVMAAAGLWSTVGFVVNSGSETLSKIDFSTGEVDNSFCVLGWMPNRVELTQDYAYVVNSGDNNVQKIDLETGQTDELIFIGLTTNPYDIIICNEYAYVTGSLSNKVYKIDLNTDEVVANLSVGGNPAGMAVLNGKLYVGNTDYANSYADCTVSIIDLSSFSITNTVSTEVNPQFLAAIDGNIHISCGGDWGSVTGKICVLAPATEEIIEIINIGGPISNFAVSPDDVVYVGDGYGYNLYAYHAVDFSIIYDSGNPFTPGGSMVAANDDNLFVLGGEWGENFTVRKFDFAGNQINEYTVALYSTDLKLLPEETGVINNQVPDRNYQLCNYPNPFNPSTTIQFETTNSHKFAQIEIYNLKGQKVKILPVSPSQSHKVSVTWDGTDQTGSMVSSGVYFYRLFMNGKAVAGNKMILMK